MDGSDKDIGRDMATLIEASGIGDYAELERTFRQTLADLVRRQIVALGRDDRLGGEGLTVRVRLLLEAMGYAVHSGREGFEDLIVSVPGFAKPSIPLVLEVKSGKAPSPTREQLRQLDDWVFEVSGERAVRRRGLENQGRARSWVSQGAVQAAPIHPTPHKGVFLYNGPLGQAFEKRSRRILGLNEHLFAETRSFCVISFPCLLTWADATRSDASIAERFWSAVQRCHGELPHVDEQFAHSV